MPEMPYVLPELESAVPADGEDFHGELGSRILSMKDAAEHVPGKSWGVYYYTRSGERLAVQKISYYGSELFGLIEVDDDDTTFHVFVHTHSMELVGRPVESDDGWVRL